MPGQPSEPCAAQAGEPFMNSIFISTFVSFAWAPAVKERSFRSVEARVRGVSRHFGEEDAPHTCLRQSQPSKLISEPFAKHCITTRCGLPVGNLRMLAFIVAAAPALARPMPQVPGMRAAAPVPVYYDHDHEVCAHKAHSTRTPRATHRKAHGSRSTRFRAIELPGPQVDASDGAQCVVGPTGNQTAAAAV